MHTNLLVLVPPFSLAETLHFLGLPRLFTQTAIAFLPEDGGFVLRLVSMVGQILLLKDARFRLSTSTGCFSKRVRLLFLIPCFLMVGGVALG